MAGTVAPFPKHQFFDNNGNPASGYQLFTYSSGTSNKLATHSDADLTVPNSDPIILDSAGRCTIFLTSGYVYKFVFSGPLDSDPPSSPLWSIDGVSSVPPGSISADADVSGTAGENIAGGDVVYLSDGSGALTAGRWYRGDADNLFSSTTAQTIGIAPSAITTGASGSIRRDGRVTGYTGLTPGAFLFISATAGALTPTPPTNARVAAQADSATSVIVINGNPDATASAPGNLGIGAQTFGGLKTFSVPPLGLVKFALLASDFTKTSNITPSDVTGLNFTVAANETWAFRVAMRISAPAAADSRFRFTGPAAPTSVWYGVAQTNGVDPAAAAAFSTDLFSVTFSPTIWNLITLEGLLRNGANAGTVQLQAAQWVSDAGALTITAGAYIWAMRLV